MSKMQLGEGWYDGNTLRWRIGRVLSRLSMLLALAAIWVLPVPQKSTITVSHVQQPGEGQ